MLSTPLAATAVLLSAFNLVNGQTYTDCNPTEKTCPGDPGYGDGSAVFTDFTKGESDNWSLADGTTLSYGTSGAEFKISASTDAPTISSEKYIFFGQVDVFLKAAPGTGIVSSFILESDDLDEIDWEWLGSTDTSVESNFFGKGNTTTYDRAIYHDVATPIETWHNYSIVWTSAKTEWYIDGALQRTLNYGDALALEGKNYPQTPMRVKMGNWVGCASVAAETATATEGTCSWAGGAADFTNAASDPFTMLVANVTINDYGCGGNYTYSDETGDYTSIKSSGTCGSSSSDSSTDSSSSSGASSSSASTKTTSGGILVQTSASSNATKASTLSTTTATGSSTVKTTSSSTTSSGLAQVTTSDANDNKHKYGILDFTVIALGLGLGYLVM